MDSEPLTKRQLAGLRLRAARLALGYDQRHGKNQAAFYELFNVTQTRASNWETGVSYPSPDFMVALGEKFGVGPEWILSEKTWNLPAGIMEKIIGHFTAMKSDGDARPR